MSIEKLTAEEVELSTADAEEEKADANPKTPLHVLSLEVEDDFGGDPYNRTGQFLQIELKNREE